MQRVCRNPDCTLLEGGVCARSSEFDDPLQQCPDLGEAEAGEAPPVVFRKRLTPADATPTPDRSNQAPWSGRHISESEADHLMYSSPARVLGLVGPYSAGKTCLITSLFLQLADGQCEPLGYRFASSRTLHALQTLCSELTAWDGRSEGEMVSHTPKQEADEAGSFIHLGLRPRAPSDDRHIDLLIGDVAGEHFSELTSHADPAMQQRMAFLHRCDGFVLVVDAIALHGSKGRQLDAELARMAGRLIDLLRERGRQDVPIAVVLSKVDAMPELPRETAALREHIRRRAPRLMTALRRAEAEHVPHELFAVAAIPQAGQPFGVQACFGYLLGHADRHARWPRWTPEIAASPVSSFLAMRAWRDAP